MNRHLNEQELLGAAFELEEGETLRAHQAHLAECGECRSRAGMLKARIEQIELLRDDVHATEPLVARTLAALEPAETPGRLIFWPRAVALLASAAAVTVLAFWQPWKKSLPAQPDNEWTTTAAMSPHAAPAGAVDVAPSSIMEPEPAADATAARAPQPKILPEPEAQSRYVALKADRTSPEPAVTRGREAVDAPTPVAKPAPIVGRSTVAEELPAPAVPAKVRAAPMVVTGEARPPAPPAPAVPAAPAATPAPGRVSAPSPAALRPLPAQASSAGGSAEAIRPAVAMQDTDGDSVAADAAAFSLPAAAPMERASPATATGQVLRIRIPDGNRIVNETPAPGITVRLVRIGSRIEVVTQNRSAGAITLSLLAPQTGQSLRTFSIGASATATNRLELPAPVPNR